MRTSPHQIEAFTYAARERSFSKAAKALGISQSAVTQHIGNLERAMGVQLFVRRRTGLELTKPAQDLYLLSDRMCTAEQLVAEQIESYGALGTGYLKIIANAPSPALPLITQFSHRYPDVRISFTLCSWTIAMERVKQRDIDVAIITNPGSVESIYTLELVRSKYMAYLRNDHPLAERKSLSLKLLQNLPVIVPEEGSLTQRILKESLQRSKIKLNRVIEMSTFPMVKEAVLHGAGIGILLDRSFYPSRQIAMRSISELSEVFRTFLVAPADKCDLRLVRSFIDIAEEQVAS
ncbi:MAG: LysR family transcriptional regulator [Pseudomonadota bacterium]